MKSPYQSKTLRKVTLVRSIIYLEQNQTLKLSRKETAGARAGVGLAHPDVRFFFPLSSQLIKGWSQIIAQQMVLQVFRNTACMSQRGDPARAGEIVHLVKQSCHFQQPRRAAKARVHVLHSAPPSSCRAARWQQRAVKWKGVDRRVILFKPHQFQHECHYNHTRKRTHSTR